VWLSLNEIPKKIHIILPTKKIGKKRTRHHGIRNAKYGNPLRNSAWEMNPRLVYYSDQLHYSSQYLTVYGIYVVTPADLASAGKTKPIRLYVTRVHFWLVEADLLV
jgi:hypothetical protein